MSETGRYQVLEQLILGHKTEFRDADGCSRVVMCWGLLRTVSPSATQLELWARTTCVANGVRRCSEEDRQGSSPALPVLAVWFGVGYSASLCLSFCVGLCEHEGNNEFKNSGWHKISHYVYKCCCCSHYFWGNEHQWSILCMIQNRLEQTWGFVETGCTIV